MLANDFFPVAMLTASRSPSIVVLGSINVDLVVRCPRFPQPGETVLAEEAQEIPGGKGANQAAAAARLGAHVCMIGRVGSDAYADRLLANLRAENVEIGFVQRTENSGSVLAIVSVDPSGENTIMVVPGANCLVSRADVEQAREVIRKADFLLVQLEIPIDTVRFAVRMASELATPMILDPAPAPENLPGDLLCVDVICPNQSEAEAILGCRIRTDQDAERAAMALTERGPSWAMITRGAKGVVAGYHGGSCLTIPAVNVEAVDTTAAGDAFAAALAVALAKGFPPEEAIQLASMAGALAASRWGAQPSLPTWQEIESQR
jgi:ribokinase